MKKYSHNGEEVILQHPETSFLEFLHGQGITPCELTEPDMDYRVFRYETDGRARYACVAGDRAVYLTGKYPDDGFRALMDDVRGQDSGGAPQKTRSRLSVAIGLAEGAAWDWVKKQYPGNFADFFHPTVTGQMKKELVSQIRLSLTMDGYDAEVIEMIDAPEEEKEYVRKIWDGRGLEAVRPMLLPCGGEKEG